MKAIRVQLAESSLERYANLLGNTHDIKVVFKSNHAYTIGNMIVLPAVPTNAPDEYVETLTGYLNAEVADMLYKDISEEMMERFNEDSLLHTCFSTIEKLRCQNKFLFMFPGAGGTLNAYHAFQEGLLKEGWFHRTKVQQVLATANYCCLYGKGELYGKYLDRDTRKLVDQAIEIIGEISDISSTEESLRIGEQLRDLLIDLAPPPGQAPEANGQGGGGDSPAPGESLQEQLLRKFDIQEEEGEEEEQESSGANEEKVEELDSYRIYTTEFDSVGPIEDVPATEGSMDLIAFRAEANKYIGVVKHKLTNNLRTMTLARYSYGHEEGDLDTDALAGLATKSTERVFQRKEPAIKIDTAVAIAIDHSCSMKSRDKIKLAAECAITIGDVLAALNVPLLVYGYSTMNTTFEHTPPDISEYARWGSLWLRTYSDFNRPWREGALKLCKAPQQLKTNSFDGESVLFGLRKLLARKEKRKILFVLSDGAPDPGFGHKERCKSYLKSVVDAGMKAGVEIVGFGIDSTAGKPYYENATFVHLHKLEDIVKEPLNIIDRALRKGSRVA